MRFLRGNGSFLLLAALAVAAPAAVLSAQDTGTTGGWICGLAQTENGLVAIQATLSLYPEDAAEDAEPLAQLSPDRDGRFCFKGMAAGFYQLRVRQDGWPVQPPRRVEARDGLVNRLTPSVEIQFEPGEPSVPYAESFDGMSATEGSDLLRRLVDKGDTTALREAARRLLPKRGVTIELRRFGAGFDPKPLVQELMHILEETTLPPLKTARYLYIIGELGDPRTEEIIIPFLLDRLRDGRTLPLGATLTEKPVYVSDIVIQEITRYAGKDFRWEYGQPPLRNSSAISRARDWWRLETEKRNEK